MNTLITDTAISSGMLAFLHTMDGPDFLLLYLVWFFLTFGAVIILRSRGYDRPLTTLGGLAAFELLGLARWWIGSAYGMHKWGFLFLMMIAGGIIFLLRFQSNRGSSGSDGGSNWWSSCSGGSSGGGDGGGGGGCGGCGGGD